MWSARRARGRSRRHMAYGDGSGTAKRGPGETIRQVERARPGPARSSAARACRRCGSEVVVLHLATRATTGSMHAGGKYPGMGPHKLDGQIHFFLSDLNILDGRRKPFECVVVSETSLVSRFSVRAKCCGRIIPR